MTSLLTRLLRRSPRAEHLTFTVYTRAQCCCCHKALDLLREHQPRWGFAIEEIDVDGDPELVAEVQHRSPGRRGERQGPVPGRGESRPAGSAPHGRKPPSVGTRTGLSAEGR